MEKALSTLESVEILGAAVVRDDETRIRKVADIEPIPVSRISHYQAQRFSPRWNY